MASCRQTADTFDAAATFFSLVVIWGAIDAETQQKIKFAKWNATRILKAIKEGKDPNESNPKLEDPATVEAAAGVPDLDPNDPEVRLLQQAGPSPAPASSTPVVPLPASVEDAPDGSGGGYTAPQGYFDPPQPSPLSSPYHESARAGDPLPGVSPELPPVLSAGQVSPQLPPQLPAKVPPAADASAHSYQAPRPIVSPPFSPTPAAAVTPVQTQPSAWQAPSIPNPSPYVQQPPPPQPPPATIPMHPAYNTYAPSPVTQQPQTWQPPRAAAGPPPAPVEHKNISLAQKHAKWAVSALNFDDVPTAVKELRNALAALGVRQ